MIHNVENSLQERGSIPYLKLVCFVFFSYLSISQTVCPLAAFSVQVESAGRGGLHRLCFVAFRLTVRKLWISELFLVLINPKNTLIFILVVARAHGIGQTSLIEIPMV